MLEVFSVLPGRGGEGDGQEAEESQEEGQVSRRQSRDHAVTTAMAKTSLQM